MAASQIDPLPSAIVNDICAEYGRDEDAKSQFLVTEYMRLFSSKALTSPYLQRLYVRRAYAQYLQALQLESKDKKEGDVTTWAHFAPQNYEAHIKALTEEIVRIEGQAASLAATIGQMTNVVPVVSPSNRFPASSPSIIGGPDAPRWFRR